MEKKLKRRQGVEGKKKKLKRRQGDEGKQDLEFIHLTS
jgi:hypothetical protein